MDDSLVRDRFNTEEDLFEMNNGCICCTVRGDLIRILSKLIRRGTALDAIIIETTGLADPGPVAQVPSSSFTDIFLVSSHLLR